MVKNAWLEGEPNVMGKLQKVREESQKFNREIFGNIFHRKHHLEARLKGLQNQIELCPSSNLIQLERELYRDYFAIFHHDESL